MQPTDPHAAVSATNKPTTSSAWTFALYLPSETDAQFQARLEALRTELSPVGLMEALIVDRLLQAIIRLRECDRDRPDVPENIWLRAEAQADRLFWRAYRELLASQKRRGAASPDTPPASRSKSKPAARKSQPAPEPTPEPEPQPETPIELDPAPINWRERIGLDPKYSRSLPLVRGTRISAEHVAGMLKAKWPIHVILSHFPQLTVDDIRACRDCHAEGRTGPWDPED